MLKKHPLSFTLALALTGSALAQQGPQYTITDLGPIVGDDFTRAQAINNHGEAVGVSVGDQGLPTIWLPEPAYGLPTGPNALPGFPGTGGANAVSDAGHVTGSMPGTPYWPYVWDPVEGFIDLGALGAGNGVGRGVNSAGQVIGEMNGPGGDVIKLAFLYDGGEIVELPTFGGLYTRGEAINELGQAVGSAQYANPADPYNGDFAPALWLPEPAYGLPAGLHDLDTIPVERPVKGVVAKGINDLGQVVMWGDRFLDLGGAYTPLWIWLPEPDYGLPAGTTDLGFVDGLLGGTSWAQDISNRGEIVFRANWNPGATQFADYRATLWLQGQWYDLNEQIPAADQQVWLLDAARGINDHGQIVGEGFFNGELRGFLLTPVVDGPAACSADITGPGSSADGVVDALDYLLMIKQWGDCLDCEADITGPDEAPDGVVDALDFLALNAQWGDCPDLEADGACCFAFTGDCQQLSAGDCAFMGGSFTPGASCDSAPCIDTTGACCLFPLDECIQTSQLDCSVRHEAVWLGSGVDCATASCPAPATGDWIHDPHVIDVPYSGSGSTDTYTNRHDYDCVEPSWANDVVYAYTPTEDVTISITTCRFSLYDTKLYVYENDEDTVVACNEGACSSPLFPQNWLAAIDAVSLTRGQHVLHRGRRLDPGVGLLHARHRHHHPRRVLPARRDVLRGLGPRLRRRRRELDDGRNLRRLPRPAPWRVLRAERNMPAQPARVRVQRARRYLAG